MKAVAITGIKKSEIIDLVEPIAKGPYVKIKLTRVPLCTEWKQWTDGKPCDCLGHEAVGVVVDSASSTRVKNGDRVVVMPQHACGVCQLCLSGDHIHCENPPDALAFCESPTGDSTYTQYLLKEDFLLLPIPEDISDDLAALCLCGLGPTFNAMTQLQVNGLDTVLVSGLGAVGCGGVINAKARGARVLALEMHPYRIKLGKTLGVEEVLNPTDPDLSQKMKKLTNGIGVDKAVETSSAPTALATLGQLTKRKGHIACVGWSGEMPASTLVSNGLTLMGAWHWNHLRCAPEMWKTIRGSEPLLNLFITHHFPMSKVQEAWLLQSTGACGKILMDPWN